MTFFCSYSDDRCNRCSVPANSVSVQMCYNPLKTTTLRTVLDNQLSAVSKTTWAKLMTNWVNLIVFLGFESGEGEGEGERQRQRNREKSNKQREREREREREAGRQIQRKSDKHRNRERDTHTHTHKHTCAHTHTHKPTSTHRWRHGTASPQQQTPINIQHAPLGEVHSLGDGVKAMLRLHLAHKDGVEVGSQEGLQLLNDVLEGCEMVLKLRFVLHTYYYICAPTSSYLCTHITVL